jgi:hypothetical protein
MAGSPEAQALTHAEQLETCYPVGTDRAYYLAHYSHRFSYLYVETPKVSCSTVKRALQLLEVDWDDSRLAENVHDRASSPLPKLWREKGALSELFSGPNYFRFCFVRNPYTRVLSAYLDKIVQNEWERERLAPTLGLPTGTPISFNEFLTGVRNQSDAKRDIHWLPQTILLQPDVVPYDFIGRFEAFQPSFVRVLEHISVGASKASELARVQHHQTNAAKRLAEFLGPRERDLIQEIYVEDFRRFCYSTDPLFADL